MTYFGSLQGLADAGAAAVVVSVISEGLMGPVGMVLAVLGVVACPITSGDTAFRSLRLTVADSLKLDQSKPVNRYKIVVPTFVVAVALLFIDFSIIWRYFSWSNQTLATIALWAAAAYLKKQGKNFWVAMLPAMFMTVVVTCYILIAAEGFGAIMTAVCGSVATAELVGVVVGLVVMVGATALFFKKIKVEE
ncbi:MAG: carbon starvation CstA 5TM domain-containing protein [Eubacteriales bacterium]